MLVLGGVALFAIRKANSWLILLVVECGNAVLLFVILVRMLLAREVAVYTNCVYTLAW
jgi:hypothetical protein